MTSEEPDAGADPPDTHALRFEQAIVAVALLSGFVFRWFWMIPLVGVLLLAALLGNQANLFIRVYDATLGTRLTVHPGAEPRGTARVTRLVEVGLLAIGSLFVLIGADGAGWLFALPVAAITAVAATTGINLVSAARDWRDRRGPRSN